jgi:hypothetical protein
MLGKPVMAVKALKKINVHGDTHDVWINPLNPEKSSAMMMAGRSDL